MNRDKARAEVAAHVRALMPDEIRKLTEGARFDYADDPECYDPQAFVGYDASAIKRAVFGDLVSEGGL